MHNGSASLSFRLRKLTRPRQAHVGAALQRNTRYQPTLRPQKICRDLANAAIANNQPGMNKLKALLYLRTEYSRELKCVFLNRDSFSIRTQTSRVASKATATIRA